MLLNLTVRNFALVAELSVSFQDGLTAITGESGAGKSILLGALGLVLGDRASKSQIRPGASHCEVIAEFDLTDQPNSTKYLEENELVDANEKNYCVVRRVANSDGRSRAWINSIPVNLSALRDLCQPLVEIHGQFAQQQLLSTTTQLEWLDDFLGDKRLVQEVQSSFEAWQNSKATYESTKKETQQSSDRKDLLSYQVNELDELNLGETEFEETSALYKRLSNLEQTKLSVAEIVSIFENKISPSITQSIAKLEEIEDYPEAVRSIMDFLNSAEINVDEAADELRRYDATLQQQNTPIDEVSSRLDRIHEIARKHKVQPLELAVHADQLRAKLAHLDVSEQNLEELAQQVDTARATFLEKARQLSNKRRKCAAAFTDAVKTSLAHLNMKDVKFEIAFEEAEHSRGLERIEFLVSPNPKYGLTPLKNTASGGELSRISLAIMVVVSNASKLPCLILDEADIGFGGTTADTVGRMLRALSNETQVICVTHAAQVAALAKSHLQVLKSSEQDVGIVPLDKSTRIEEIARMVGGREVNQKSRDYAQTLLKEAI